jgi:hypothetical protein
LKDGESDSFQIFFKTSFHIASPLTFRTDPSTINKKESSTQKQQKSTEIMVLIFSEKMLLLFSQKLLWSKRHEKNVAIFRITAATLAQRQIRI